MLVGQGCLSRGREGEGRTAIQERTRCVIKERRSSKGAARPINATDEKALVSFVEDSGISLSLDVAGVVLLVV
jgi:hypothetical protein